MIIFLLMELMILNVYVSTLTKSMMLQLENVQKQTVKIVKALRVHGLVLVELSL